MQSETPLSGSSTERVDDDQNSITPYKSSPNDSETWPITREVEILRERNEANGATKSVRKERKECSNEDYHR